MTSSPSKLAAPLNRDEVARKGTADVSVFDMLVQPWLPCTESQTVLNYLRHSRIPSSYRPLCAQWNALGRPALQTAMTCDLEAKTLHEESISLSGPTVIEARSLEDFLVFLHNYCSFCVELSSYECSLQNETFDARAGYDYNKRMFLANLESDRAVCRNQDVHDCLGRRIWGPAYSLEIAELWRLLIPYRALLPQSIVDSPKIVTGSSSGDERPAHQDTTSEAGSSTMHLSPNNFQHLRRPALITHMSSSAILNTLSDRNSSHYSPFSDPSTEADFFSEGGMSDVAIEYSQIEYEHIMKDCEEKEVKEISSSTDSKRRKEQNRIKSKRHRDRMIKQRNLLLDIISAFMTIFERPNFQASTTFGKKICKIVMSTEESISRRSIDDGATRRQVERERRRRSKSVQRIEELERFEQVYRISCLLLAEEIDPMLALDIIIASEAVDPERREHQLLLGVFVQFREQWDVLLEAESRLHISTSAYPSVRRPIADLVNRLRNILGSELAKAN